MNEAADAANGIPAIILFLLWCAFISMLDRLSRQNGSTERQRSDAGGSAARSQVIAADHGFPELNEIDPELSTEAFLTGACVAYEEILRAYMLCDLKTLRPLLSAEVYQAFADSCAARTAGGETLELTLIGIQAVEIADIEATPEAVEITVCFRAQIVRAERSAAGEIVGGDPRAVMRIADLWTFSRPLPLNGEGWVVVATDAA